jgi:hypothetical protein
MGAKLQMAEPRFPVRETLKMADTTNVNSVFYRVFVEI